MRTPAEGVSFLHWAVKAAEFDSFFASVERDSTRRRVVELMGEGLQQRGNVELELGRRVGLPDASPAA